MDGMDGYDAHARVTRRGHRCRRSRRGTAAVWLALFAADACVEDPIGPSMFDPEGAGHRGPQAIAAFYDTVIASGRVEFSIRESYAAGNECANVGTITTTLPDGTRGSSTASTPTASTVTVASWPSGRTGSRRTCGSSRRNPAAPDPRPR